MLNIHFRGRPTQWKYGRRGATSDIIFRSEVPYFRWTTAFTHCNYRFMVLQQVARRRSYFDCVRRPEKSAFSFTVLELLLPVYGGYYLFPVFHDVARRRSYYGCVRRPQKCTFGLWNFPIIIHPYGVITTSGLRRLLSISGVTLRCATSVILPLCRATS